MKEDQMGGIEKLTTRNPMTHRRARALRSEGKGASEDDEEDDEEDNDRSDDDDYKGYIKGIDVFLVM